LAVEVATLSRLAVVVPACDEVANIGDVVREIRRVRPDADVLVVDDGSGDATGERARETGARVLRLPFNCGIGAAVQTGLGAALAGDYEFFARLDGDGQHDPADLGRLVARLDGEACDFALGSRFLREEGFKTTRPRRMGSRWFSLLLRALSGLRVSDPTSGFWAANRVAAAVLYASYASDYPEVDSLVHLARRGLRVAEEPVIMRERGAGRSSIDSASAVYFMIKVTVALVMSRISAVPGGRARSS
jgi:glycosyltransferase involved in cell wall biosynthesis